MSASSKRYLLTAGPRSRPAAPPTSVCVTPARRHSPGTYTHQVQVEKDALSQAHKTRPRELYRGTRASGSSLGYKVSKDTPPSFLSSAKAKGTVVEPPSPRPRSARASELCVDPDHASIPPRLTTAPRVCGYEYNANLGYNSNGMATLFIRICRSYVVVPR